MRQERCLHGTNVLGPYAQPNADLPGARSPYAPPYASCETAPSVGMMVMMMTMGKESRGLYRTNSRPYARWNQWPALCQAQCRLPGCSYIRDRSRGLPLDRVKDTRRDARFHADCLEAMPPAMVRGNVRV
jgi:hypothetical protein